MTRLTYEDIEVLTLAPYRALCAMGASPARAYARAVERFEIEAYDLMRAVEVA